ncbi:MAG: hypothetical protein CVV44_12975 [Spirochaetae bacterium HGW-Spirochaetae-1]|jgi:hypothetical protein|nr:MAG: hypothetical protein CVV44_12975 [Spirochaetae bacterium HGW-Spirochaetae-1]
MQNKTFSMAVFIAALLSIGCVLIFEDPARPFTVGQSIALYALAFLPALGIAMLFDPYPASVKAKYLKVNFYTQDKTAEELVAEVEQQK